MGSHPKAWFGRVGACLVQLFPIFFPGVPPRGLVWEGGDLSGLLFLNFVQTFPTPSLGLGGWELVWPTFYSSDPRDFFALGPTPRLGLGGWELVWSTSPRLPNLRQLLTVSQKATFGSFPATIKGYAFRSQGTFLRHTTAHIFLQRTFHFFLLDEDQSYSELCGTTT